MKDAELWRRRGLRRYLWSHALLSRLELSLPQRGDASRRSNLG